MPTLQRTSNSDFINSPGNQLLAVLPHPELIQLQPHVELTFLPSRGALYDAGDEMRKIYFPVSGIISVLTVMMDGSSVEAACIGREGMVGIPALLGRRKSPHRCVMQVSGSAWQIPTPRLAETFQNSCSLHHILTRYIDFRLFEAGQVVGCNFLHTVKQRLATWLLRARVRVQTDEFPLTHEFLSLILGAQRSTVTLAARELETAELIRYKRGHIKIVDVDRLQQTACECYEIIEREINAIVVPQNGTKAA